MGRFIVVVDDHIVFSSNTLRTAKDYARQNAEDRHQDTDIYQLKWQERH